MKILRKTAIWIITLLYLVVAFGFVSSRFNDQLCNTITVSIEDSLLTGFIDEEHIINTLQKNNITCLGEPLASLNLKKIEEAIQTNQIVNSCKAYTGINGTLHVDITQRKPFVRIINNRGNSYYLDKSGNVLHHSTRYAPHVLVFNGNIKLQLGSKQQINLLNVQNSEKQKCLQEIYQLATYIDNDDLWRSQFVQVYLNTAGEYELIPRIGPHIIILGTMDNYEKKLEKLRVFYKEGLNNTGWNNYLKINLKYKDQVVCTKI